MQDERLRLYGDQGGWGPFARAGPDAVVVEDSEALVDREADEGVLVLGVGPVPVGVRREPRGRRDNHGLALRVAAHAEPGGEAMRGCLSGRKRNGKVVAPASGVHVTGQPGRAGRYGGQQGKADQEHGYKDAASTFAHGWW